MDPQQVYMRLKAAQKRFYRHVADAQLAETIEEARLCDALALATADTIADLFTSLNEWLAKGGFPPKWEA